MTTRDHAGRFTAERTTTTVTERVTIEPAGLPSMAQAWAALTAPLEHYEFPVWPQAWWTAANAYTDEQRQARDGDMWLIAEWSSIARRNTDLLAAAGHAMAGYDGTLSEEAQAIVAHLPAMMP